VAAQIGAGKYLPHLTVGAAKFDDLKIIEAEPFDAFSVHPAGVAVYHLGNNGTARKLLKAWPVATPEQHLRDGERASCSGSCQDRPVESETLRLRADLSRLDLRSRRLLACDPGATGGDPNAALFLPAAHRRRILRTCRTRKSR
jgi:hypothetical protein